MIPIEITPLFLFLLREAHGMACNMQRELLKDMMASARRLNRQQPCNRILVMGCGLGYNMVDPYAAINPLLERTGVDLDLASELRGKFSAMNHEEISTFLFDHLKIVFPYDVITLLAQRFYQFSRPGYDFRHFPAPREGPYDLVLAPMYLHREGVSTQTLLDELAPVTEPGSLVITATPSHLFTYENDPPEDEGERKKRFFNGSYFTCFMQSFWNKLQNEGYGELTRTPPLPSVAEASCREPHDKFQLLDNEERQEWIVKARSNPETICRGLAVMMMTVQAARQGITTLPDSIPLFLSQARVESEPLVGVISDTPHNPVQFFPYIRI